MRRFKKALVERMLGVPRDRAGTFEPQLIPKHARRVSGFDDKILALYARGMTVRGIQALAPHVLKSRGQFPTDDAAIKLIWFVLRNITTTWHKEANFWHTARNQFAIIYGDRFTAPTP